MTPYNNRTYAVVHRKDPTRIAAGPHEGFRGGGLAAPFYGNDLEDAKKEVMLTFAEKGDENMEVNTWLEKMGWEVVQMNSDLEAQYDNLFEFEGEP
jgi:hypothetical protein